MGIKITVILFTFAFCTFAATVSMLVPAVDADGGGRLVNISVDVREGDGTIYISTKPLVGVDTQASERIAVEKAFDMVGIDRAGHDVLFKIEDMGGSDLIDGPSGGAAMTLLTYASLTNSTINEKITMTGSIRKDGKIGGVGGLVKKVKICADGRFSPILVPLEHEVYEEIMLEQLTRRWGVKVYYVENIREVINISIFGEMPKGIEERSILDAGYSAKKIPKESAEFIEGAYTNDLRNIGRKMIADARSILSNEKDEDAKVIDYFKSKLDVAERLLDMGYIYTGANDAFLTLIDARWLMYDNVTTADSLVSEVEACVSGIPKKDKTYENFDWVGGAELRGTWAEVKLSEVKSAPYRDEEDTLLAMRDLMYVKGWCESAHKMLNATDPKGNPIDENALKAIVEERMKKLEALRFDDADLRWHLKAARHSYSKGRYVAAMFDLDYVESALALENNLTESTNASFNKKYTSFWADIYGTHAAYYSLTGDYTTASRLRNFAERIENSTIGMRNIFMGGGRLVNETRVASLLAIACLITALALILTKVEGDGKGS